MNKIISNFLICNDVKAISTNHSFDSNKKSHSPTRCGRGAENVDDEAYEPIEALESSKLNDALDPNLSKLVLSTN
ncbi:hypothetical protein PanWU01x14_362340 [Parasponia andersonii]|uniref:Uncharacterized protein n=1 Tax=Parasponia andersonii TaxID=3476 RepID=A0A2P5A719_PARAD|nr:hypothetical protein PanWU01x14_362340 [Parasponia andersonii]